MIPSTYLVSTLLACALLAVGCVPSAKDIADGDVWVTLPPQRTIVAAVVGERKAVHVMVRPGQSPETYAPGVPQMAALAKADLYFGIGMPFERSILAKMERSMPQLRFIATAAQIEGSPDEAHHVHHGHHAGDAHGAQDPHVWMDPQWMLDFVGQVRAALIAVDPAGAVYYSTRAEAVTQQLRELDTAIHQRLEPYAGRNFYINHPSLGHFAERYHLKQRSIEQAGSAPSAKQIAELVQAAKSEPVGAVFTQPEFGRSSADVLARALNVEVVELDVLSADYFNNLLDIARQLEDSFKQ